MIADYLYNAPVPAGAQCVLVLLKKQYANSGEVKIALVGKTISEITAQSNVIGVSGNTPARVFGFSRSRKLSSVYAGFTAASNFELPSTATFTVTRGGYAEAIAVCLVASNVVVRAVTMLLQRTGDEATATRLVFSVDDNFVSDIEGPAFIGQPIGDVLTTVIHAQMEMIPSLIGLPVTGNVVHQQFTASSTVTPPSTDAQVVHASMQMIAAPTPSTIDRATIQSEFREALPGEYTLSADERTLTKIGTTDTSSRSFEVTGKPRPNTKCFMRVRFNGSPYPVITISNGLVKANNQVAWTIGSLAANVWHEVKVEHVSGNTYKYTVNGSVLYTGTATNLTFYSHTNVMVTEVDTGQLGTALPAGFVWL